MQVPQRSGAGRSGEELERGEDHAEKQPRAELLIDDAGVLADPADAGVLGVDALDDRAGIDVAAGLGSGVAASQSAARPRAGVASPRRGSPRGSRRSARSSRGS